MCRGLAMLAGRLVAGMLARAPGGFLPAVSGRPRWVYCMFGYLTPGVQAPESIAAVDLGSNSFHMIVARVENGQIQIIDRIKEMVRLGAGLNPDGRLAEDASERALACLERFGQRLRSLTRGSVAAVGTNTLRQVEDGGVFLRAAECALGHPIEIVPGHEEARLVYLGVAHGLAADGNRRLVVDIGGGSTELIIGEGFNPLDRESLGMGCVSHSLAWFADGAITEERMGRAVTAARVELRPFRETFSSSHWGQAVGSSGTIKTIRDVVQAAGWSNEGITRDSLKQLRDALLGFGAVERIVLEGLSDERKPVFVGGVAVLTAVFNALNVEQMQVSDMALREGLLYEMLGQLSHSEDVRERSVETLARRFAVDLAQATRVEMTAAALLVQVARQWNLLDADYSSMLRWACQLHEVGLVVSHSQFHRHGAYLLDNADLPGFSRRQQQVLSTLVLGHRRKFPQEAFERFPEPVNRCIQLLCVLLRLSVLLHRGRSNTTKPMLLIETEEARIELRFPDGWLDSHPLTQTELAAERDRLAAAGFELISS